MSSRKDREKRDRRRNDADFGIVPRARVIAAPTATRVAAPVATAFKAPAPVAPSVATNTAPIAAVRAPLPPPPPVASATVTAAPPVAAVKASYKAPTNAPYVPTAPVASKAPYVAPSPYAPRNEIVVSPQPAAPPPPPPPPPQAEPERAYIPPTPRIIDAEWEPDEPPPPNVSKAAPVAATPNPRVTPSAPAPVVKAPIALAKPQGLFARFMAWLGFVKASSTMHGEASMSRLEAAGSLVRRARHGDQNAMAIIDMARINAEKGNVQARLGVEAIKAYIRDNPVSDDAAMNGEADTDPTVRAAIHLADGPYLSTPRIAAGILGYSRQESDAFKYGFKHCSKLGPIGGDPGIARAMQSGKVVGLAKRLQNLRLGAPLKEYDADIGWEIEGNT